MLAEVVQVTIEREELAPSAVRTLRELFNMDSLPLAPAKVSIEIKGISTAAVNAFRRVITDEMPGHALKVPIDGFNSDLTSDVFMLPQFVNGRIELLRLRPQIPADIVASLRLRLDVTNGSASTLNVHAGDLKVAEGTMPEPLFNPTTTIAFLPPGTRIVVENIYISTGYGRDNGIYNVTCRAAYSHLDIPQHSDAEMRHENGVAADESGYKVSSMVAVPRHHMLTAIVPATTSNVAEIRAVFADACTNIKERLRLIATTVERRAETPSGGFAHRGVQFTVMQLEEGLSEGVLQVPGETHTIGELIKRTVYELAPDIANVSYTIVAHENRLVLTIRHTDDVARVLARALQHAIATFDEIQRGVMSAPLRRGSK